MSLKVDSKFDYNSDLPYPGLYKDARILVLSDWDKTITMADTNDHLSDNYGMGAKAREDLNVDIADGGTDYKVAYKRRVDSIKPSFEECKKILIENTELDPGFPDFFRYCKANDIPFVIVSSGMIPLIRAVLTAKLPEAADIDIIAHEVKFEDESDPNSPWTIVFRHPESVRGHDKSMAIKPYRELEGERVILYCGDGVSDKTASKHVDVLFAKELKADGQSSALLEHAKAEEHSHVPFSDFSDVQKHLEALIGGKSHKDLIKEAGHLY